MTGKRYRFFAHFNRIAMQRGDVRVWTLHWRGQCIPCVKIDFHVPIETQYRPLARQPRAILRGYARSVEREGQAWVVR